MVAGGVAANGYLRRRLEAVCAAADFSMWAPPPDLCTDNAAMIAWAGVERLRRGLTDPLDTPARARWPLDETRPLRSMNEDGKDTPDRCNLRGDTGRGPDRRPISTWPRRSGTRSRPSTEFVSVERFESLATPGKYLSLSLWRDEEAVRAWRANASHQVAQAKGKEGIFASYRIRVADVVRAFVRCLIAKSPTTGWAA